MLLGFPVEWRGVFFAAAAHQGLQSNPGWRQEVLKVWIKFPNYYFFFQAVTLNEYLPGPKQEWVLIFQMSTQTLLSGPVMDIFLIREWGELISPFQRSPKQARESWLPGAFRETLLKQAGSLCGCLGPVLWTLPCYSNRWGPRCKYLVWPFLTVNTAALSMMWSIEFMVVCRAIVKIIVNSTFFLFLKAY